jgi:hypothetical protein
MKAPSKKYYEVGAIITISILQIRKPTLEMVKELSKAPHQLIGAASILRQRKWCPWPQSTHILVG